jgi:hypothetical protein
LTDSATIFVCLSIAFFLSSFDHKTFEKVATDEFETEQKGEIYYHVYANVANRIV